MQAVVELPSSVDLAPAIAKLTKDEKSAARLMTARQARYIVDSYYQQQENRKRGDNQVASMEKAGEPHALAAYLAGSYDAIESRIQSILDHYSDAQPAGRWARSIVGIGPVIAAGLLAHIDIERSVTVGDIYSFAGLNPSRKWEAKTKRPWNARLKVIAFKIGTSFTKVCNHEDDVYGKVYQKRKAYEWEKNLRGDYADQARQKLADFNIGEDTDARAWYEGRLTAKQAQEVLSAPAASKLGLAKKLSGNPGSGVPMLPPAHVQQRCERYAAKLFLSGFHCVSYYLRYEKLPPVPYAFAKDTGSPHAHYFYVPNSHLVPGLREAEEAQYR